MPSTSRRKIVFLLELLLVLTLTLTWQTHFVSAKPLPQVNGSYSIWDDTATPDTPSVNDPNAIELGVKFQADVDGYITGIRFYKGVDNTGTHIGNLWSSDGTLLATATFVNETDSGWQQVDFATPAPISANTTFVASYHTDVGFYAATSFYFATSGVDNPPLQALADGVDGGNGVYQYGPTGFPTSSYNATNYWVDVVYAIPDTTPPTVSVTNPADGAVVSGTVTVSADATDDVGVAGVQFLLDGANLGAEDTAPPYSISWDSTTGADGVHQLAAVARDDAGNTTTSSTVSVTVDNNTMPTVTIAAPADGATFNSGQAISFSGTASDSQDGNLTASLSWVSSIDGSIGGGGSFSRSDLSVGLHTIAASVTDSGGMTGSDQINITISTGNTAPTVTNPGDQTNAEGDSVTLDIAASDPDGDTLTFSASGLPSSLSIDTSTGQIAGTLTFDSAGVHSVTVTADDGNGGTDSVTFGWTINDINRAPVVTNPGGQTTDEGDKVTLNITASDPDGDVLTFSASRLPRGLAINAGTGRITGTPTFDSAGVYNVTVTVSDGTASDSAFFRWTVSDVNRAADDDDDDDDDGDDDSAPSPPPATPAPAPAVASAPTPAVTFLPETGIGGYSETRPTVWPFIVILPGLGLLLSWSILRRLNKRQQ